MAVTAAIALSASSVKCGAVPRATLTVTNGNAAAILVMGIQPTLSPAPVAVNLGQAPWGGNFPQSVAASGSQAFLFDIAPWAPSATTLASPSTRAYTVGATILLSDGSTIYASTASLTAAPPNVFPS